MTQMSFSSKPGDTDMPCPLAIYWALTCDLSASRGKLMERVSVLGYNEIKLGYPPRGHSTSGMNKSKDKGEL